MADLITKVFVTSGLLGGVGGLGYAVTYYLSGYTLGDTLKDKGHNLLSYEANNWENKAEWEKILKAYSENGGELKGKKIKLAGGKVTVENINELKKLCADTTSLKKYDKKTSELTEQYCVKPVTVIELLHKDKNKRILNWSIDDENNSDNSLWDSKINEHSRLATTKQIQGLKFSASENTPKAKRDKFRGWCKGLEGNRTHNRDYQTKYLEFVRWCAV